MPVAHAAATSQRLLALLSLLQARRDWPAPVLAARLHVGERTIRRDVDRLRELGYAVEATRGPEGGYRLEASAQLPPLLLDDEQAVAIAIALRTASLTGVDIDDAAQRALATVSRLMPDRLRHRVSALDVEAVGSNRARADPNVLLEIGKAMHAREGLRFDYRSATGPVTDRPPRRLEPHHMLLSGGRWYVIGWSLDHDGWRVYRIDRMALRTPNGPRFSPRTVPGGDAAEFLAGRFKSAADGNRWPCVGKVVLHLPASRLAPFVGDETLEDLGPGRCSLEAGSWSWVALAARFGQLGSDLAGVDPRALREAFRDLAVRYAAAGRGD